MHRTGYVSPYPLKTVEPLGGRAKGRSTSRDSGGRVRDHPFSLYTAARIEKAGNMSFFSSQKTATCQIRHSVCT